MTYLYRLVSTIFLLLNFSIAFAENNVSTNELFENKIRKFILENPEVILDSLRNYEEKININAKKIQKELIESEIVRSLDARLDYVGGNLDGKITMFEFLDYKCGYCKKAHAEVKHLLKNNPEITLIIKEFPILGPESLLAAKASIAVLANNGPSMYEEFTNKLINFNKKLNIDNILQLAKSIGADPQIIKLSLGSDSIADILNSNYTLANKLNINGTPTFIIGTEIIRGYKNINALQEIINRKKQAP